ncbi:hypothetical protein HpCK38_17830 [Helicobacter pylori]
MDFYQIIAEIFGKVTDKIILNTFNATQDIFGNGFFNGVIIITALIWLVSKIAKSEQFAVKDTYPILIFLLTFYSVYFITQNQKIYIQVLDLFQMPRNALTYIAQKTIGNTQPADILKSLYVGLQSTQEVLDQADGSWYNFNLISKVLSVVFFLLSMILIAVLAFILILSTLIARIVLSFGAFMFLCLLWNKTRGFFFSWLKLYLSFSLYAPLGVMLGSVALEFGKYASNSAVRMGEAGSMDIFSMLVVIVGMILCIFMFLKIPNIVNGIVGSSNDSTTGASGLIGFMTGIAGSGVSRAVDYFKGNMGQGLSKLGDFLNRGGKGGEENPLDQDTQHS